MTTDLLTAPQEKSLVRHTSMPQRKQRTPFGDVTLTSRWMRDRYQLVASGPEAALRWMFPKKQDDLSAHGRQFRIVFSPAPMAITVERQLRQICARWQEAWDERLLEAEETVSLTERDNGGQLRTLGQLFDYLYEERRPTVAASTNSRDRYRLQLWRDELGNDTPLESITPEAITAALTRLSKRLGAPTINPALGVLKTYLNWAADCGHLPNHRHRTVKKLREASGMRSRREWWTAQEVELAIRCAKQDHHQPTATLLVAIGCFLGLRVEEAVMLRWQDLDLDSPTGKPIARVTPHAGWQPKDGEARDIPISDTLLDLLKPHRQADGYLLQPEPGKKGRPREGKGWVYRYDPKKVWARIMELVKAAGGKPITMYGMRHSFASNLLIASVSDVKVARWLGHSDTRMVHRHYGHLLSYDEDINAITRGRSNLV
ncbi:MAG: site-specific integrase [Planctomycetota bacterium]|nr:MAG: site-specific integrase [Planctomycetota bacterium]